MQEVPIVFATNNAYALYAYVAIKSIMEYAQSKIDYVVYIFTDELSTHNKELLINLSKEQFRVNIIDINKYIEKREYYTCLHFSKEMYYRLYIPLILPQYKKVLYMDCDMVVIGDVYELYETDISQHVVAAVKNPINNYNKKYIEKTLHFNYHNYFNSGLLLINCLEFEKQHIRDACFEELERREKLLYPDQDILNIVCENKIHYLEGSWNFQQHHLGKEGEYRLLYEYEQQFYEDEKNAKIIHFSGGNKPWDYPDIPYAYIFWNFARGTVVYEEIIFKSVQNKINKHNEITAQEVKNKRIKSEKDQVIIERNQAVAERDTALCELEKIRNSYSYNIGLKITYIPRKIVKGIRKIVIWIKKKQ